METKIFAQIHSLKEISKQNYLIDIEIVSLDDNGIIPNKDFIIKAGNVSKNRTTNNKGFYRNDEFFESKEVIKKIELLNTNKGLVSKYFLPINKKSDISNNRLLVYAEIQSLIDKCGSYKDEEKIENEGDKKTAIINIRKNVYGCTIKQNGAIIIELVRIYKNDYSSETEEKYYFSNTTTINKFVYSFILENKYSISDIEKLDKFIKNERYFHFEIYGDFDLEITEKSIQKSSVEENNKEGAEKVTNDKATSIGFISDDKKVIKRLNNLLRYLSS